MCFVLLSLGHGVSAAPLPAGNAGTGVRDTLVVVRPGDHLWSLARRYLDRSPCFSCGEFVALLQQRNPGATDTLRRGQRLIVPLRLQAPANHPLGHSATFSCRGIYLPTPLAGSAEGRKLVVRFARAGGNTVVFDAKNRLGRLGYASTLSLAADSADGRSPALEQAAKFIEFLHALDMHVVARVACFYDAQLASVRPDLAPLMAIGGQIWSEAETPTWVDPSRPEVQQYLLDVIGEVVLLGVDEVQLDYLRFPTGAAGQRAVYAFDPEVVPRTEIITDFVVAVRRRIAGSGVLLGADLFGVAAWGSAADATRTGQRLEALLPYLDVVSPMLYPSHFYGRFEGITSPVACPRYLLFSGCRRMRRAAQGYDVAIRPWIQAFAYRVPGFDAAYVLRQLAGATAGGAAGWMLWNPAGHYAQGLRALELMGTAAANEVLADSLDCPQVPTAVDVCGRAEPGMAKGAD